MLLMKLVVHEAAQELKSGNFDFHLSHNDI